ncbi:hypothetical protein SGPA1_21163 [Streptomyces misionensis JCM 4497]
MPIPWSRVVHRIPRPLRRDALPAHRAQRAEAPRAVARPVAQLRPRPSGGDPTGHPAPGVRPGHHPFRPGQQLRPAARRRRVRVRRRPRRRPGPVPRRTGGLHQGRLSDVAGPVRGVRLAQVPAGLPGPEPAADGPGVRRHLLLPPPRPGDSAGGDDGRPAHGGAAGQGALRRHLQLLRRADPGGRPHPRRTRHPAPDPPAALLPARPAPRGRGPARRPGRARDRLHRLLPAGAGPAHRPLPRRHPGGFPRRG